MNPENAKLSQEEAELSQEEAKSREKAETIRFFQALRDDLKARFNELVLSKSS